MTQIINQEINVNSFYFAGKDLRTFPRQIEFAGEAITFGSGLRYLIHHGERAVRLFDMSTADATTYRLRQDGSQWTLVGTL